MRERLALFHDLNGRHKKGAIVIDSAFFFESCFIKEIPGTSSQYRYQSLPDVAYSSMHVSRQLEI